MRKQNETDGKGPLFSNRSTEHLSPIFILDDESVMKLYSAPQIAARIAMVTGLIQNSCAQKALFKKIRKVSREKASIKKGN